MTPQPDSAPAQPLTRETYAARAGRAASAPPVRIVHIGLGAFHRAHQAWYTAQSDPQGEWGIAAFTGRNATAALELAPQGGLYTLIERSADGDEASVVTSIAEAVDGADLGRFVALLSSSSTAIVTTTITEPGYRLTAAARPNLDDAAVRADVYWLARHLTDDALTTFDGGPGTALGRLVLGLHARRLADGGPLAIVPCDNMPDNGRFVAIGLTALAALANRDTAAWIADNVSFVSTSVDRITPRTTPADIHDAVRVSGWLDTAPVITEPFRDWVLSGEFPAGRPAWERAGARFVDDIEPFERRKLWLLNGAHSLLAYAGRLRGHETVASAIADETCLAWVEIFWDEAARHLPDGLDLDAYRTSLLERFRNARIEHQLAQIGMEGVTKLRVRFVDVLLAERAAGRDGGGGIRAIGSWLALVTAGVALPDAQAPAIAEALASGDDRDAALLRLIDARLSDDAALLSDIRAVAAEAVPALT